MGQVEAVIAELRAMADPGRREGQARVGIQVDRALGVSIPALRRLARRLGRDHVLALALWDSGVHEARILTGMVDDPSLVTPGQMERWVLDFDSWDVCDQVTELFERTPYAWSLAFQWAGRNEEFVRRAAFALIARMAVHRKQTPDDEFVAFFPLIRAAAGDDSNFAELLSTCPQYCGHCTCMDLVGNDVPQVEKLKFTIPQKDRHQQILDYLRKTPSVRDVVVSGGDIANLHISQLEPFVSALLDIPNIRDIRLASKGLAGLPQHYLQPDVLAAAGAPGPEGFLTERVPGAAHARQPRQPGDAAHGPGRGVAPPGRVPGCPEPGRHPARRERLGPGLARTLFHPARPCPGDAVLLLGAARGYAGR